MRENYQIYSIQSQISSLKLSTVAHTHQFSVPGKPHIIKA